MPIEHKQYGDCEGPLGFPMVSEAAKELDIALKAVSKEIGEQVFCDIGGAKVPGYIRLCKGSAFDFDAGERSDVSYITTEALDCDKEVVISKGLDFSTFKRNPVVGYGHNYSNMPVGRAEWWKFVNGETYDKTGWIAKTTYATKPSDWSGQWLPDGVWHLIKNGFLPGKSIGMLVQELRRPEPKDIEKRAELSTARFLITKALLVEYSVVGVQANQMAVVQAVAKNKSLFPQAFISELGLQFPEIKTIIEEPKLPSIKGCATLADVPNIVKKKLAQLDVKRMIAEDFDLLRGKV